MKEKIALLPHHVAFLLARRGQGFRREALEMGYDHEAVSAMGQAGHAFMREGTEIEVLPDGAVERDIVCQSCIARRGMPGCVIEDGGFTDEQARNAMGISEGTWTVRELIQQSWQSEAGD